LTVDLGCCEDIDGGFFFIFDNVVTWMIAAFNKLFEITQYNERAWEKQCFPSKLLFFSIMNLLHVKNHIKKLRD
jgi:hypothetical protein